MSIREEKVVDNLTTIDFDNLQWLDIDAGELTGLLIEAVEPPVGPDGAVIIYGRYRTDGDRYVISVFCDDDTCSTGGMRLQRAQVL